MQRSFLPGSLCPGMAFGRSFSKASSKTWSASHGPSTENAKSKGFVVSAASMPSATEALAFSRYFSMLARNGNCALTRLICKTRQTITKEAGNVPFSGTLLPHLDLLL
jgi:hypothetical protein